MKTDTLADQPQFGPEAAFIPPGYTEWNVQGDDAASFISDFQNETFFKPEELAKLTKERTTVTYHGGLGCFTTGTRIQISGDGDSESIEKFAKGMDVLSHDLGGTKSGLGTAKVSGMTKIPGHGRAVYGFNEGAPFFTDNHVFVTNRGLRAVSPRAARLQNPWAVVGKLRDGMSVCYSAGDGSIEWVKITHISRKVLNDRHGTSDNTLYDLHFPTEGTCFFANGFLVSANTPAHTTRKLAKNLRGLDRPSLQKALATVPELKPVIERFGTTTVLQSLQKQLHDPQHTLSDRLDPKLVAKSRAFLRANLLDVRSRTWDLQDIASTDLTFSSAEHHPKSLELHDGSIFIDGEHVPRALVKPTLIAWSRQTHDGSKYEHGYCKFDPTLFSGNGAIFYSDDSRASTADTATLARFSARMRSSVMLEAPMQSMALEIAESKAITESINEAEASNTQLPPRQYNIAEQIRVTYDKKPWDVSQGNVDERPLQEEDYLFDMVIDDMAANLGVDHYEYRIPKLDELAVAVMNSSIKTIIEASADDDEFGEKDGLASSVQELNKASIDLYESVIENHDGEMMVMLRLTEPGIISNASDQHEDNGGPEKCPITNLTFRNLGLDLKLPFLFTDFTIKMTYSDEGSPGAVRKLDPGASDNVGPRHALKATTVSLPEAPVVSTSNLTSIASLATDGDSLNQVIIPQPAPVFAQNKWERRASPVLSTDLLRKIKVDNEALSKRAQDIIYRTMLYHMNEDHRKKILDIADRPGIGDDLDRVPEAMANHLDKELAKWLNETYAPAYMCMQLSTLSSRQVKEWDNEAKFTADDKKRIHYWWTGKGSGCLVRSDKYRLLNDLATSYAFRQLAPELNDYMADGGSKWAATLSTKYKTAFPLLNQLINNQETFRNICNVLQALEPPSSSLAGSKSTVVVFANFVATEAMKRSAAPDEKGPDHLDWWKARYDYTMDNLKLIINGILTNDPAYGSLKKPFENMVAQVGKNIEGFARMEAADKGLKIQTAIVQGATDLGINASTMYQNYQDAIRGGIEPQSNWMRIRMATGAQRPMNLPPAPNPQVEAGWRSSLFFLSGAISIGFTAYGIYKAAENFYDLSPEGKARFIVSTIRSSLLSLAALPAVLRAGGANVKALWTLARNAIPRQPRAVIGAVARVGLGQNVINVRAIEIELEDFAQRGRPVPNNMPQPADPEYKFLSSRRIFGIILSLLTAALIVVSIYELANNWSKYESGQGLLVAQVVVQIFQVIAEVVAIYAINTLAIVTAVAIPLLIIAGIVLMILAAKYLKVKREPTDYETWVKNTGRPFVQTMPKPPKPLLTWSLAQAEVPAGKENTIQLIGKNTSNEKAELDSVSMRFFAGSPHSCLFQSSSADGWKLAEPGKDLGMQQVACSLSGAGNTYLRSTVNLDGPSQGSQADGTFQSSWMVMISGSKDGERIPLSIEPQASLTLSLRGSVATKGSEGEGEEQQLIITEALLGETGTSGDIVREFLTLKKV